MRDHIHPLPVCGFDNHRPHAPGCANEKGRMIACGTIIDPNHPHVGMALCRHLDPPPPAGSSNPNPGVPTIPGTSGPTGSGGTSTNGAGPGGNHSHGASGDGAVAPLPSGSSGSSGGHNVGGGNLPPTGQNPPETPFDWIRLLRWILAFIAAGLLAWLLYWLWLWLKKWGFWVWALEKLWRAFDWFRRLREWLEGPADPPHTPPEEPADDDSSEEEDPEDDKGCQLASARIPTNRTPIRLVQDRYNGIVSVSVSFDMLASFSANCSRCEYEQLVMGRFDMKPGGVGPWITKKHWPPGSWIPLSNTSFIDDGYGHRAWSSSNFNDRYEKSRSDGCEYIGHDEPGMNLPVGDALNVVLSFEGRIWDIDPVTGARVEKYFNEWNVHILGQIAVRQKRFAPWPNLIDYFFPGKKQLVLEPLP